MQEMYLIHNQPFGSWYQADEFCAEVKYSLDAIDINPDKSDLNIGTTGAVCHDCFAYAGAVGVVGMHCYAESGATYCDVSASIAGGFEYNIDLLIKDPTITTTVTVPIWEGVATELGRFGDSLGVLAIVLDVTPVLNAEMSGTLTATGERSATAHAAGVASHRRSRSESASTIMRCLFLFASSRRPGYLELGARVNSDEFTAYATASLEFDPLTFETTGFEITAEESEIVVTPVRSQIVGNCTRASELLSATSSFFILVP